MNSTKLTVVIPAHNEEENINLTLVELEKHLELEHEVVVVLDHCSDGTRQVVEAFMEDHPNVRWVENLNVGCFANSVGRGFEAAEDGAVVVMMADLSDDPKSIEPMYRKLKEGFDVVCGSRYMAGGVRTGGPLVQGLFSRFVGRTIHWMTGIPTRDISNAFKMYRKEVLNAITTEDKWFAMSMELAVKAYFKGYRLTEVPTVWTGRVAGESSFKVFSVAPSYVKLYLWTLMKRIQSLFVQAPPLAHRRAP